MSELMTEVPLRLAQPHNEMQFYVVGKVVPYVRMTQRGKWVDRQAIRYMVWKEYFGRKLKEIIQASGFEMIPKGEPIWSTMVYELPGPRTPRFDLDNAIKGILDASQGIVFENDMDVERIVATRVWGAHDFGVTLNVRY